MEVRLTENFITLKVYRSNLKRGKINNLNFHIKIMKKQKQIKPKISKRKNNQNKIRNQWYRTSMDIDVQYRTPIRPNASFLRLIKLISVIPKLIYRYNMIPIKVPEN